MITQGHYGYSLIVEISFTHDSLLPWLGQLEGPLPLLLLDADWIQRSPKEVEFIKERLFPVGLLGKKGMYSDLEPLNREIAIFEQAFSTKPLWYTTRNYQLTGEMTKVLFKNKINMLAPTVVWSPDRMNEKLTKGSIISIPFHEESVIHTKTLQTLLHKYQFISIEENIFGYSIQKKTFP